MFRIFNATNLTQKKILKAPVSKSSSKKKLDATDRKESILTQEDQPLDLLTPAFKKRRLSKAETIEHMPTVFSPGRNSPAVETEDPGLSK